MNAALAPEPRHREMRARALPVIQMFWHGPPLSRIERLSMTSFMRHGHPVHLYAYEELVGVPQGVRLMDAAEILPRKELYMHRQRQSVAHFADWFRYRLLFERGGMWADTDVVCLQPFDYEGPVVFAWQDEQWLNNAVLGLPAGDALAQWLAMSCEFPNRMLPYDSFRKRLVKLKRRLKGWGREYVKWGDTGPYGLTSAARHLGYMEQALPKWHFYPVPFEAHRSLFESPGAGGNVTFGDSRAVHLWNQLIGQGEALDKNARFPADSPFEQLWARYMGAGAHIAVAAPGMRSEAPDQGE